jgi:16S rRNA (cytosine1407-C5)-methyltransferase
MKSTNPYSETQQGAQSPVDEALERFRSLLSPGNFKALQAELQKPFYPAIRANRLKTDPQQSILKWQQIYEWQVEGVPYCPDGWWIKSSPQPISSPVEHRLGFYYIQDAASMLPVTLFDFSRTPQPLILDMAASPGGKTTHLVDRSSDRGLVIANDSSKDRITALRLVLQNWGAMNIAITRFPGENIGDWFPETFDTVLLDAPCSMQNLRSTENRPMRPVSDRERQFLARRQERMLISALQAVKSGGEVVYSTCTLNPEEDEAVLDAVLRRYGNSVMIRNLESTLPRPAPALTSANLEGVQLTFLPQVHFAVRLWPHIFGTSGFFAALLTKLEPIPTKNSAVPQRPLDRTGLQVLSAKDSQRVNDRLLQSYGFDFQQILELQNLSLWRRRNVIYALPDMWMDRFRQVPFQAVGMRVAEEIQQELQPSHEWMARFGTQFQAGKFALEDEKTEAWLRGEDLHGKVDENLRKGQIVLVVDHQGRLYGRGKVLANRLRNMLPTWTVYTS